MPDKSKTAGEHVAHTLQRGHVYPSFWAVLSAGRMRMLRPGVESDRFESSSLAAFHQTKGKNALDGQEEEEEDDEDEDEEEVPTMTPSKYDDGRVTIPAMRPGMPG